MLGGVVRWMKWWAPECLFTAAFQSTGDGKGMPVTPPLLHNSLIAIHSPPSDISIEQTLVRTLNAQTKFQHQCSAGNHAPLRPCTSCISAHTSHSHSLLPLPACTYTLPFSPAAPAKSHSLPLPPLNQRFPRSLALTEKSQACLAFCKCPGPSLTAAPARMLHPACMGDGSSVHQLIRPCTSAQPVLLL